MLLNMTKGEKEALNKFMRKHREVGSVLLDVVLLQKYILEQLMPVVRALALKTDSASAELQRLEATYAGWERKLPVWETMLMVNSGVEPFY